MKILVWGTGFAARELLENELKDIPVYGYIDNSPKNELGGGKIMPPSEACRETYDAVVVATGYSHEIYKQAQELGFDLSKFIFVYNNYKFEDLNCNYALCEKIFGSRYADVIRKRYRVIRRMMLDEDEENSPFIAEPYHTDMHQSDYNRIRTFELIVDEIKEKQVKGAVAELGVFKGEFAKYINAAFPDRKCYLFDTFKGFQEEEALQEKFSGNCGDAFIERFKDTEKEKVLSIMPYAKSIVCKEGLFPDSLDGLEEEFAFVSIDVDFKQSIYNGLEYFYPRLNCGGYIFIHDYNSSTLKGVKEAVAKYEKDKNISLAKVPICDLCGTLVITK